MASGVNIKMGVSGVSQFKQSMNSAKQTLKTLDAQLALTEKEFKATGDQEAYMAKKSAELEAKLEAQKNVVSNAQKALDSMARNGVDRSSKAYQDLYREMLKAKGEMIDTEQQMQSISTSGDEAASSVDSMNQQLKRVGDGINFQNVTNSLDTITKGMEAAAKKAIQLGKAIIHGTMDAAHQADELITRSTKYGIGVEELQAMDYVAEYVDTDVDTIIAARKRLQKAMGSSDKETMGAFAAFDIDPNNTNWEDAFWKIGEGLKNIDDEVDRNNYATKLFGKSYDDLLPLFETGRQKYEEMLSEQTVLTEDQVKALGAEDDAMKRMEQQIDVLKKQFWAGLAPAITEATDALSGLVEQFNIYLQSEKGQAMLEAMGDVVSGLFSDLSKIDPEKTIEGVMGILDGITSALRWVADNKDGVVKAVEGFILAWAGLETAKGVTTALQLINGLKWLKGGGPSGSNGGYGGSGTDTIVKASPFFGTATTASSKAASVLSASGMLPAVGLDMFLNQTNAGRALRDGTDILEGVNKDLEEKAEEIQKNSESFLDNWNPANPNANPIARMIGAKYGIQPAQTPELGSDWNTTGEEVDLTQARLKSARNGLPDIDDAADKMAKAAEDLTGGTTAQKQSSSEMTAAASELKGLPGVIQTSIREGMSGIKIYIDGKQAGYALSPYVGSWMGAMVAALSK